MRCLLVTDGTNGEPVATVAAGPADIDGIEVHAPSIGRIVRIKGRRPVDGEDAHFGEVNVAPVSSGGKEDTVTVAGGNLISVHSVLHGPGPSAILPQLGPFCIGRHSPFPSERNMGGIILQVKNGLGVSEAIITV